MYEDKTLVCKDCGNEFVFTAGEQEFYASRGFENEPQRCKACRDARKNAGRGTREMFTAVCASCGKEARVRRPSCVLQRLLCEDEGRRLIFASKSPRRTAGAFLLRFENKNFSRPGKAARGP